MRHKASYRLGLAAAAALILAAACGPASSGSSRGSDGGSGGGVTSLRCVVPYIQHSGIPNFAMHLMDLGRSEHGERVEALEGLLARGALTPVDPADIGGRHDVLGRYEGIRISTPAPDPFVTMSHQTGGFYYHEVCGYDNYYYIKDGLLVHILNGGELLYVNPFTDLERNLLAEMLAEGILDQAQYDNFLNARE